jgi:hypothetical protein
MPLLYGEGREKAFIRLQEAIFNVTADHSLFLYRYSMRHGNQPLLGDSPKCFCDNTNCTLCSSRGIYCFLSSISYTGVFATIRWGTQAHEQIMTTVTSSRNEMSTTLPLLDYQGVSDKLVFFNNNESRATATHVAILNHSIQKYINGAFCLLLRRTKHKDVFQRLNCFPAILPSLVNHKSKIEKTKILLCAGPRNAEQNGVVLTTFIIAGNLFVAQKWSSAGRSDRSIISVSGQTDTSFTIRTNLPLRVLKQSAQISCQIMDSENEAVTV